MAFLDRAPRVDLSFPVEFLAEDGLLRGHCLNLSASGMLATFPQVPELWTTADLVLHFGEDSYRLPVRVARTDGRQAGLTFAFRDARDRAAVTEILAYAAANTHLVSRPPF